MTSLPQLRGSLSMTQQLVFQAAIRTLGSNVTKQFSPGRNKDEKANWCVG